jgi:hypothetical protein
MRTNQFIKEVGAFAATLVAVWFIQQQSKTNAIVAAAAAATTVTKKSRKTKSGRYLRHGSLLHPSRSFWTKVYNIGDDLEFLHFTAFSREAFNDLVLCCKDYILSHSVVPSSANNKPKLCHTNRRLFKPHDIIAMTLRYLLSTAEYKDLHVHFGAVLQTYIDSVQLGLQAIIYSMINHPKAEVLWKRNVEDLQKAAAKTSSFLDIPGVIAMVDGTKLQTRTPSNHQDQNRDYNGWTKDVNRNLVLVWDPFGKIVDCGVNAPGSFHDSRTSWWCNIYSHFLEIPDGFKCVCDDAFCTSGDLAGKLVKTKEEFKEGFMRGIYDQSLTHLRQCSEWGNNILTGNWRRLRTKLPTDNVARAQVMWASILLHNYRTETMGRNQIRSYFEYIETVEGVNIEGLDDNAED